MNYYPRHIGDYLKDTAHLTLLEHGVYARLLDIYYDREGALPTQCEGNANAMLHRLIGARNDDERRAVDDILAEFFVLKDGAWHNKRADEEIEKNAERAKKASESASKRWGKCEGNANAMPTQCEGNAPQKPKAKSQIDIPPTPKGVWPSWLDDDPLEQCCYLGQIVAKTTLKGGKPACTVEFDRATVERFVKSCHEKGADDEAIDALVKSWSDYQGTRKKASWTQPFLNLYDWAEKREEQWRRASAAFDRLRQRECGGIAHVPLASEVLGAR